MVHMGHIMENTTETTEHITEIMEIMEHTMENIMHNLTMQLDRLSKPRPMQLLRPTIHRPSHIMPPLQPTMRQLRQIMPL